MRDIHRNKSLKNNTMRSSNKITALIFTVCLVAAMASCRKDYLYEPPAPHTSQPTTALIAQYTAAGPNSITAAYWKSADYLKINAQDASKGLLYGDGMLNMTGTYTGVSSFNNGADPGLTMKAAYDNENVYILAEWTDLDVNAGFAGWAWNGPSDALKASESNSGWTSQGNCDRFAMAFEIQNASSNFGTFSNVGCQAACHNNGTQAMHPDAGSVDIWNWNLAHSAPLGYAEDMVSTPSGLSADGGQPIWMRNSKGSDRSGPAYEWDGTPQNITLANGKNSILDPKFYLMNKAPFKGNIQKGDSIFHKLNQPGECNTCHGEKGEGATEIAINSIGMGSKSRADLINAMNNVADMGPYISGLNQTDFDNLVAYIKGIASGSTPGAYLQTPNGSCADIIAVSNVTVSQLNNSLSPPLNKHTKYQVLIIRKLKTGKNDDIQFDLTAARNYKFGVALMNSDGKNHIGSIVETLIFK
jgi:mono/diheme cytochrome c family protein